MVVTSKNMMDFVRSKEYAFIFWGPYLSQKGFVKYSLNMIEIIQYLNFLITHHSPLSRFIFIK